MFSPNIVKHFREEGRISAGFHPRLSKVYIENFGVVEYKNGVPKKENLKRANSAHDEGG